MFGKIAAFEFRYQVRQPVFWVVAIIFFLLTFGLAASDVLRLGDTSNVHKNSPFNIAQITIVMSVFYGMFVTAAFVANVVVRDDETGFGPIVRATRIDKLHYLYGRFAGAWLATAAAFLAVPLGVYLGSLMPWVDSETLGPNRFGDYLWAYGVIGLPSLLLTSALFFAMACMLRSMMGTYLGVIVLLIAYVLSRAILGTKPELLNVAALADPFGAGAFGLATRYWTATERNTLTPAIEGLLLWNRVTWIGVSLALLALTYPLFRFTTRGAKAHKQHKLAALADAAPAAASSAPLPRPVFDARTARTQLWARTRFEMALVFKSPVFLVLVALGLLNSTAGLFLSGDLYGVSPYPVTRFVIVVLHGGYTLIPWIIAIFYAGELVWRDRDKRTHEIIDATAAPDWSFLLPKAAAVALVLAATYAISVLAGMGFQLLKGYTRFELDHYLLWYLLPYTVDACVLAALAVFIQALVPNKFLGWGLTLLFLILTIVAAGMGADDNLFIYGEHPEIRLSDMNGAGKFWQAAAWFQAYWSAFALGLLVIAYGLWRRGTETRLMPRLRRLPSQLKGAPGGVLAAAACAFVGLGVWIFVNTHVWNTYRSRDDLERRQADYEKTFLKYETLPQPTVVSVKLDVDLHPHVPEAVVHGRYELVNQTSAPISDIHVRLDPDARFVSAAIPGAVLAKDWPRFSYRIYHLAQPLAPGARTVLTFQTWRGQKGFRNDGYMTRIVDNGTFLDNFEFAPQIGMNREFGLLQDPARRRKHHLTPDQLRPPALDDRPAARQKNYLANAAWVNGDVTITTDADQTPIAPGYKVSDVTKNGRRTARFVTDAPILNFFSIQSARYAEKHESYRGVDIAVYYDPKHPWNADRMIRSAKAGLDYYDPNFSPYQFRQLRFIEFPDYAVFAQSFANTVPWSEAAGFIADVRNPAKIDYVTYIGDHELGHQWWAHQVIGAYMQGDTLLSETQAQYSAMMVMKKLYGPDKIRRFLKYELDSYLRARGGEKLEELPLERVEDQGYIHYNKGAVVMYLLQDQIGEDNVDAALRDVLRDYAFKGPPYPTSLELVRALRAHAPADKQELITDLFEKITLFDVKATKVDVKKRPDGKWAVRLTVEAKKLNADSKGKETEAPMKDESYDFGLFSAKPGEGAFDTKDVILFERRPLSSGTHVFDFVVARKPLWAGVDPYNKRIDRNSDDNLIRVEK